jgi:ABC-type antimicrobial peptide transport system permease subunit
MVVWQSVRPVGFGPQAGGGLAAGLATVLMSTPAASNIRNVVRVFDPWAYAVSLLVIVIACMLAATVPALHAARLDPIATLKNK